MRAPTSMSERPICFCKGSDPGARLYREAAGGVLHLSRRSKSRCGTADCRYERCSHGRRAPSLEALAPGGAPMKTRVPLGVSNAVVTGSRQRERGRRWFRGRPTDCFRFKKYGSPHPSGLFVASFSGFFHLPDRFCRCSGIRPSLTRGKVRVTSFSRRRSYAVTTVSDAASRPR